MQGFTRFISVAFIWLVYLPIVGITYVVVWLDRKLKFKLAFPRDLEELSRKQEWCINALKANSILPANATVLQFKVTPLNQELIFRSNAGIIEIIYEEEQLKHTLKCFAKFAPTVGSVWNRTIFNLQLNHTKESDFNRLFVAADPQLPSPRLYYSAVSAGTGNLCLITEFMEDCVEHKDSIYADFTEAQLDDAVKGLAKLHSLYWLNTEERMKKVLPIENSTILLFDSIVSGSWSKNARIVMTKSWSYTNHFQTVLHGDARIGNMMFPSAAGKGRFVLFDWQAVRKGRAVYDLAYFLILSLQPAYRKKTEQQCLDNYYAYLIEGGVKGYSKDEMHQDYRHACLCLLSLLSLPLLSGEASAEGQAIINFAWGMNVWRKKLLHFFTDFDYDWMATHYGLDDTACRSAVSEMLGVIEKRLVKMSGFKDLEALGSPLEEA